MCSAPSFYDELGFRVLTHFIICHTVSGKIMIQTQTFKLNYIIISFLTLCWLYVSFIETTLFFPSEVLLCLQDYEQPLRIHSELFARLWTIKLNKMFEMLIQYLEHGEQSMHVHEYYFFNVILLLVAIFVKSPSSWGLYFLMNFMVHFTNM